VRNSINIAYKKSSELFAIINKIEWLTIY
jgi:hypothetical protein